MSFLRKIKNKFKEYEERLDAALEPKSRSLEEDKKPVSTLNEKRESKEPKTKSTPVTA